MKATPLFYFLIFAMLIDAEVAGVFYWWFWCWDVDEDVIGIIVVGL